MNEKEKVLGKKSDLLQLSNDLLFIIENNVKPMPPPDDKHLFGVIGALDKIIELVDKKVTAEIEKAEAKKMMEKYNYDKKQAKLEGAKDILKQLYPIRRDENLLFGTLVKLFIEYDK